MAALVGMQPLVDFSTAGPVDAPWSTALFQCGSFSFAGEKAGWTPPQRASTPRALHCNTAQHCIWTHKNGALGLVCDSVCTQTLELLWTSCLWVPSCWQTDTATKRGTATRGRKKAGPPHGASCSVHVSLRLLASPDAAPVTAHLQLVVATC